MRLRRLRHFLMQRPAMRVHRYNGGEVLHDHLPNCLWAAELLQIDVRHFLDAASVDLCRSADGVQVDAAEVLTSFERLRPHAPLADHCPYAETLEHVGLVRLFADRGGWTGGDNAV